MIAALFVVLLFFVSADPSAPLPKKDEIKPFSLTLSATPESMSGSPVDVKVTTTNTSRDSITFGQSTPVMQYQFDVRGPAGKPAIEKDEFKKMKSMKDGLIRRMTRQVLAPGESFSETVRLSDYFDLSVPGKYSVQLKRSVPPATGKGVVKSNVIMLTIRL
jgi:hypothetical protein